MAPETVYAWFRGDSEPKLSHLARMAELFGVSRYEIVAAMDGDGPVVATTDPDFASAVAEAVQGFLLAHPELLAAPGRRRGG